MRVNRELDLQIARPPKSVNYFHIRYHPFLPGEVRIWVNGEKIVLTLAEAATIRAFLQVLEDECSGL